MSIKINVDVFNTLRPSTEKAKALVVLTKAVKADPTALEPILMTQVSDLAKSFKPTGAEQALIDSKYELAQIEYLLHAGVSVLAIKGTQGTLDTSIETLLKNNDDNHNFSVITVPFPQDDTEIGKIADLVKDTRVEYHVQVDDTTSADIDTTVGKNRNTSFFTTEGLFNINSDYKTTDGEVWIAASTAAQARKLLNIENGTPYLPIAGQETGVFREFLDVTPRLGRQEKEDFQTNFVNPMIIKPGVGVHFVAQNTRNGGASTEPLNRAHANTLTNYLVEEFRQIGDKYLFKTHLPKTWDLFELDVTKLLSGLVKQDGVEQYAVVTGRRLMTETDIADGRFKAQIHFLPVRVIESIQLNLVVHDNQNTVVAVVTDQTEAVVTDQTEAVVTDQTEGDE